MSVKSFTSSEMASIFRFFHTSADLYKASDAFGTFTVNSEVNAPKAVYESVGGVVARIVSSFKFEQQSKAAEAMLSIHEGKRICSNVSVLLPLANALVGIAWNP